MTPAGIMNVAKFFRYANSAAAAARTVLPLTTKAEPGARHDQHQRREDDSAPATTAGCRQL